MSFAIRHQFQYEVLSLLYHTDITIGWHDSGPELTIPGTQLVGLIENFIKDRKFSRLS